MLKPALTTETSAPPHPSKYRGGAVAGIALLLTWLVLSRVPFPAGRDIHICSGTGPVLDRTGGRMWFWRDAKGGGTVLSQGTVWDYELFASGRWGRPKRVSTTPADLIVVGLLRFTDRSGYVLCQRQGATALLLAHATINAANNLSLSPVRDLDLTNEAIGVTPDLRQMITLTDWSSDGCLATSTALPLDASDATDEILLPGALPPAPLARAGGLQLSGDGTRLVYAGVDSDRRESHLLVADLTNGSVQSVYRSDRPIRFVSWRPNSSQVAMWTALGNSQSEGLVPCIFDLDGRQLTPLRGPATYGVSWSGDGRWMAFSGRGRFLWGPYVVTVRRVP